MSGALEALQSGLPVALCLGGLLSLFLAIVGGFRWANKISIDLDGWWQRPTLVAIGAILIALASCLFIYQLRRTGATSVSADVNRRLGILEAQSAAMTSKQADVEREVQDSLAVSLNALLSVSTNQDPSCGAAKQGTTTRAWVKSPNSACQRIEDAFLPISLTVNVPNAGVENQLVAALATLGTPVRYVPGSIGLADRDLGLLFPSDVPRGLVCDIRQTFIAVTGVHLNLAMTSAEFSKLTQGATGPTFGVQVGVSFGEFFQSPKKALTDSDWDRICGNLYSQPLFLAFLNRNAAELERRP